jgi:membrane protease YdiL (CAAX protease family)
MERPLFFELAGALVVFFCWLLAREFFLVYDLTPVAGTIQILVVGALFASVYVAPGASAASIERRARGRVRTLGAQWPWALIAAATIAVALVLLVEFYARVLPPAAADAPYAAYLARPYGIVPPIVATALVGPLVSEVIFRGWVQGRLTRAFGPEVAIINSAALYAVANLDPWFIPVYFVLGLLAGYSVYLTRSVWSGVMINMAFHGGLFLADAYLGDPDLPSSALATAEGQRIAVSAIFAAAMLTLFVFSRQRRLHDATGGDDPPELGGAPTD